MIQGAMTQGAVPQLRQTSSVREVPVLDAPQQVFARSEPTRPAMAAAPAMHAATQPLRQPVQPALPPLAARMDPRSGLFASPGQPQQAPPVAIPTAATPFTPYVAPNAGPSIFSRVTGAFKRRSMGAQDTPPRPEPTYAPASVMPAATQELHEREAEGDDIQNVPAFLRRQQSAP